MYQDNKKQLIICQVIHCVIFLAMGSLFTAMYIKTDNDTTCINEGCNFVSPHSSVKTEYDV